jgi:hypothetical protein
VSARLRRDLWFRLGVLFVFGSVTVACASSSDGVDQAGADLSAAPAAALDVDDLTLAMSTLDDQRTKAPIAPFQDQTRIEGCWINPAADHPCKHGTTCAPWSPLKKAFYCKQPLEFRICSSTVLLNTGPTEIDKRVAGYQDCQRKVDALFGGKGLFVYDDQVAAVWRKVVLEDATLAADDEAKIVSPAKPEITGRPFALVVAKIVEGLGVEAAELSLDGLKPMIDDLKNAGGEDLQGAESVDPGTPESPETQ